MSNAASTDNKDKQRLNNAINKLKLNNFKLEHLHSITKLINNNASRDEIFEKIEQILKTDLQVGKALLLTKENNEWIINFGSQLWRILSSGMPCFICCCSSALPASLLKNGLKKLSFTAYCV